MVLGRSRKRFSVRPLKSSAGSVSRSWITALPCSSSRLSIWMAGSPVRRPSACAGSSSMRTRSKATNSTCGACLRPSLRSTWKNWNMKRSSLCTATKVPRPCRRTRMCSATRSSVAWRSVPIDTPSAAASSLSLGSTLPAAQRPDSMARSSERLTSR